MATTASASPRTHSAKRIESESEPVVAICSGTMERERSKANVNEARSGCAMRAGARTAGLLMASTMSAGSSVHGMRSASSPVRVTSAATNAKPASCAAKRTKNER